MEEETKLHFVRTRAKGESAFFDPATDIRKILPMAAEMTLSVLTEGMQEGSPESADYEYLDRCLQVFGIRLAEDSSSVDSQLTAFFKAIDEAGDEARRTWLETLGRCLFAVYALFMRRDAVTDREAMHSMLEYGRLSVLKDILSPGTYEQVRRELLMSGVRLDVRSRAVGDGGVLCVENGRYIPNVRELARHFLSATGNRSWEALAEACDAQFSNPIIKSDEEKLVLALAYPDYKHPTLEAVGEGEEHEAEGEAGASARV